MMKRGLGAEQIVSKAKQISLPLVDSSLVLFAAVEGLGHHYLDDASH